MTQTFRVSNVAAYARWRDDPDQEDVGWLINQIVGESETKSMAKGTAFHRVLEDISDGVELQEVEVDGYRFVFSADIEVYLPKIREWRLGKDYGGIIISGQCDAIEGKTIYDHKTTERFDAENYLDGWQHKFYLDIFGADKFVWNVWTMKHVEDMEYEVKDLHVLQQFRYPQLTADCQALALEFKEFAARYLPIEVTP